MTSELRVPNLGESIAEATVGNWFKSQGDAVSADEVVCELETDKVTVEVPAPQAGVLSEITAPQGKTVEVGELLGTIGEGTGAVPAKRSPKPADAAAAKAPKAPPAADAGPARDPEDAPSAKVLMTENALEPGGIAGSGRDGRIMKEDVLAAVRAAGSGATPDEAPASAAAPSGEGIEERVRMTRLRATIARRLKESQNTAAMLTTYNEVDMSRVMKIRSDFKGAFEEKHGVRLGFMSFFVRACCEALLEVPEVNAEIDGDDIVYKKYVNMGIAVGTPTGLVVPVVRNAHSLGFAEIEKRIAKLGALARDGKLALGDLQGGTFSISNGGVYGSLMSSPILNPPQSGILGMHKIQERPIALNGEVVIRPMMYLALSYDHRLVDGKGAVTFLVRVKELIEEPHRLLMGI